MKSFSRAALCVALACAFSSVVQAQVAPQPLTALDTAYQQNFDTLSTTAGSTNENLTILGWDLEEGGGGARDNEQYAVDTGGSNTGDTFSYGAAGNTDRALGMLRSGTLFSMVGVRFRNDTPSTITSLDVAYTGEEWRLGTATRTDRVDFQYSLNASTFEDPAATWVNVDALDFITPNTATVGPKDGNAAGNRTALSASISSLSIPAGATFWLRWVDADASGADDGLSVDDLSVTPRGAVVQTPVLSITGPAMAIDEGTGACQTPFTFTVNADVAPSSDLTVNFQTQDGTATVANADYVAQTPGDKTLGSGQTSTSFTVDVNCDALIESDETFSVQLLAGSGYTVSPTNGTATATIRNDDTGPLPTLSVADVSVGEGAGFARFRVQLSGPAPAGGVTYDFSALADAVGANPATSEVDFVKRADNDFVIDADDTFDEIDVVINQDTQFEGSETFAVEVRVESGATAGDVNAVGTIIDDELGLSVADASVFEGGSGTSTINAVVTLSGPAPAPNGVSFTATTANGNATAGTGFPDDYQALSAQSFTIAAGQTSTTVPVTVFSDLRPEQNETLTLTIAPTTAGVGTSDPSATLTINNDDNPAQVATIPAIQGGGFQSPLANGTLRIVHDVVVTALVSDGFFIQDPVGDGQFGTSDAMFVYTSVAPGVNVGDRVDVGGQVTEAQMPVPMGAPNYQNSTKFSNTGLAVNVTGTLPLPAPITLNANTPSPNLAALSCASAPGSTFGANDSNLTRNFECMESMRVTTSTGIVTGPIQTFGSDPVAEVFISTSGQRPAREPGVRFDRAMEIVPTLNPAAPPVPASPVFDLNPELFELDIDRLVGGPANPPPFPGTRFSATGVLGNEFGGYEIFPSQFAIDGTATTLPVPVPERAADQLTIGSFNLLRLFDDQNDPGTHDDCATQGTEDFCPTTAQFTTKLVKRSAYIREVMRNPMVIAVQEVEDTSTIESLAAQLNADLAGAFTYTAIIGADQDNDGGHANIGLLVRNDVQVQSVTQLRATDTWTFNGAAQDELLDRPPLLLRATTQVGGVNLAFAVMANHLRSLNGIDVITPVNGVDHVDAHRVRQKRLRGAILVAQEIQAFQSQNPTTPLVVIGDLNAFEFSDGYADIVGILRGDADPANTEYDLGFDGTATGTGPNGNIVVPTLTEALFSLPPQERYSYFFQNSIQSLDHALLSTAAQARFEGYAHGRGNVDASNIYLNDTTPANAALRASDHDGSVVYLDATPKGPSPGPDPIFSDGFE